MKLTIIDNYYCEIELFNESILAKKGSMVSYKGHIDFESKSLGDNLKDKLFNALKRSVTGEGVSLMECRGSGTVYLADRARNLVEITLGKGDSLNVESDYLLTFSNGIENSVVPSGLSGGVSGKGFFTSQLKSNIDDNFAIISVKGKPLILETPCSVDPQALVAWTGPNGRLERASVDWKTMIGNGTGELYTCHFSTPGYVVILQPDEGPVGQVGGAGTSF